MASKLPYYFLLSVLFYLIIKVLSLIGVLKLVLKDDFKWRPAIVFSIVICIFEFDPYFPIHLTFTQSHLIVTLFIILFMVFIHKMNWLKSSLVGFLFLGVILMIYIIFNISNRFLMKCLFL